MQARCTPHLQFATNCHSDERVIRAELDISHLLLEVKAMQQHSTLDINDHSCAICKYKPQESSYNGVTKFVESHYPHPRPPAASHRVTLQSYQC